MDDPSPPPIPRIGWADLGTLAFTYFSVGVTVAVGLIERGHSASLSLVATVVINSATSILAFLAVHDSGGTLIAGVLSGWMVSSRFGLMAASLGRFYPRPWLGRAVAAWTAFEPNTAMAIQQRRSEAVRKEYWRVTLPMLMGWWIGIGVGIGIGNVLGDTNRLGLDAVFPAALLAIIGGLLRRRDGLAAAVVGGLLCFVLIPVAPAGVPILMSILAPLVVVFGPRAWARLTKDSQ